MRCGGVRLITTICNRTKIHWQEMLDADQRSYVLNVANDNAVQTIIVPSNYGMVFIRQ